MIEQTRDMTVFESPNGPSLTGKSSLHITIDLNDTFADPQQYHII